jgi:hypothetical protein
MAVVVGPQGNDRDHVGVGAAQRLHQPVHEGLTLADHSEGEQLLQLVNDQQRAPLAG